MEHILKNFAEEYALNIDKRIFRGDAQRSTNNPLLFVFVGDSVKEASEYIRKSIMEKWDNGKGIVFINISTENIIDEENVFNVQLNCSSEDKMLLRRGIREKFYNDKKSLQCLNSKITMAKDKILSFGNLFNSFESISISVITRADDPLNIIVPEIAILVKKRMMEAFKLGLMDLYVLIKEKEIEDEFFSKAVSMSFFREIEYIQKSDFNFKGKIAVYGDERELVVETKGPIFYLTYVLEEKNEKGLIPADSMKDNYEIIAYINLLKNRDISTENYSDTENQYYDNSIFKANLSFTNSINMYATAGLSKVKRPNSAIAVTVVGAFYKKLIDKLKEFSNKSEDYVSKVLKIDEENISLKADSFIPKNVSIMDMNSLMAANVSSVEKKLSKLTLKQAEESLYEDRCQCFFYENFIKAAEKNFKSENIEEKVRNLIRSDILSSPNFGIFCVYDWTSEKGEVIKYIRDKINLFNKSIESLNLEIENMYESRLFEGFSFKSIFFKGGNIQEVKKKIFLCIYKRKLEVLKINLAKMIMEKYENILLKVHKEVSREIEELSEIEAVIKHYEDDILNKQDAYTGQNVKAYYNNIAKSIVEKLEKQYGEAFYCEEKYIGNLSNVINEGKKSVLIKLTQFCSKYILTDKEFSKAFEEELNERANVDIEDWENRVLSRDELYRKIYNILEDNSCLKAYIMNYDVKGYEEKYFFGDYSSDFIKYAFNFNRKIRNCKIGYIHERRTSGIEKLNLMGGFGAKDIIYIKNAVDTYNYCIENGYELHGIDIGELPKII